MRSASSTQALVSLVEIRPKNIIREYFAQPAVFSPVIDCPKAEIIFIWKYCKKGDTNVDFFPSVICTTAIRIGNIDYNIWYMTPFIQSRRFVSCEIMRLYPSALHV
jgi:hypothetical protein